MIEMKKDRIVGWMWGGCGVDVGWMWDGCGMDG